MEGLERERSVALRSKSLAPSDSLVFPGAL